MTRGSCLDIMVQYVLKRLFWAYFWPWRPLVMRRTKFQFAAIMAKACSAWVINSTSTSLTFDRVAIKGNWFFGCKTVTIVRAVSWLTGLCHQHQAIWARGNTKGDRSMAPCVSFPCADWSSVTHSCYNSWLDTDWAAQSQGALKGHSTDFYVKVSSSWDNGCVMSSGRSFLSEQITLVMSIGLTMPPGWPCPQLGD